MIVVIDTSIWLSALLFGGVPKLAIIKATQQAIIAICQDIVMEVKAVAARKFSQQMDQVADDLAVLLENALWIEVKGAVEVCRDPKGNTILECAKLANASLIISGDKDLLTLSNFESIRIITASQYVTGAGLLTAQ